MNNLFAIFDKRSGQKLNRGTYSADFRQREKLRNEMAEIRLACCCKNQVEMKVSSKLYFYNAKKTDKHDMDCVRYRENHSDTEYDPGWKSDLDGNLFVRLPSIIPKIQKDSLSNNEEDGKVFRGGVSISRHKVEMMGLIQKLNMMTWETTVQQLNRTPKDISHFNKALYHSMRRVTPMGQNKSLLEMEFQRKMIEKMKPIKDISFIYMYIEELEDHGSYQLLRVRDRFGNIQRFYCEKESYDLELAKERGHSDILVVGGFVYRKSIRSNILTLAKFAFMPVSQQGLFVESSYEKIVYEALCNDNRLFFKPHERIEEYGGRKPDVIIIDREKPIIGEIFGMNNQEYLKDRDEKIRLANDISDIYDFWKWDAYNASVLELPI